MLPDSPTKQINDKLREGIVSTLAFFGTIGLPVRRRRIYELLYKIASDEAFVYKELDKMAEEGRLVQVGERYALKPWDVQRLDSNRAEIHKRWKKIRKYLPLLSVMPFIESLMVINSLSIGNVDQESDIDFFVITKPNRLYFVRSMIILLFKFLGVYKTRTRISERFCFGFYVTTQHLDLSDVLIEGEDPHFAFWFASMLAVLGRDQYHKFYNANKWISEYFPNSRPEYRERFFQRQPKNIRHTKRVLEMVLALPVMFFEPLLRYIHIRHTFNLPENHWPSSTTVASKDMLKLHAIDPRAQSRQKFYEALEEFKIEILK